MAKQTMCNRVTIVQFDKRFLDGALAGLLVPGQTITFATYKTAQREAALLCNAEDRDDSIRDTVTGNRFKVSNVQVF